MKNEITYVINKGFVGQTSGGKITILDPEDSLLYTLNETATLIFIKIKAGWSKSKILAFLTKRYAIEAKQAEQDLEELIQNLLNKKIISKKKMC